MNVELNKRRLDGTMHEIVFESSHVEKNDFTQLNYVIEELLNGAESCKKMIDNRRKMSDEVFYSMLRKFAFINGWNDYDCYNVIELAYGMKFVGVTEIATAMHTVVQKTEGHGRSFDWWNEEVGINFIILYTEDFKAIPSHVYTIKELEDLIAEKKIVLVSKKERNLYIGADRNYPKEEYKKFDYAYDDYRKDNEFFGNDGKFYKYTLKYIRKNLNSKKLRELFYEHLEHVDNQVYEATESNENEYWNSIAKAYSKEFEERGYAKRLAKLNEVKNNK